MTPYLYDSHILPSLRLTFMRKQTLQLQQQQDSHFHMNLFRSSFHIYFSLSFNVAFSYFQLSRCPAAPDSVFVLQVPMPF